MGVLELRLYIVLELEQAESNRDTWASKPANEAIKTSEL